MAHNAEPMDVDCMDSDFDKENTFYHNNLLPCTEKGYEELDVSELNMKLRYSITPAASPMSRSCTTYTDNRALDSDDSLNCTVENNLTRSLNSTITKNDNVIKSLKTLPLQSLPTEFGDRNSVLRPLHTTVTNTNVNVTLNEAHDIDENLSLPSTSSSLTHTPEATTPISDIKNDNGSPIMRGLKTVLNMFRPSQSPVPSIEGENTKTELSSLDSTITEEKLPVLVSTPITAQRSKDSNSSRRNSPLKESITFQDDLAKELQWKDETTIFFSDDKIPVHKLFFQSTKSVNKNTPDGDGGPAKPVVDNLNSTVEYMDISYNDSIINDRTLSEMPPGLPTDKNEVPVSAESDGEFVDCETTFTDGSQVQDVKDITTEIKDPLLDAATLQIDTTHNITKDDFKSVDISFSEEPSKDNENPLQQVKEDTDSTISIIQELDSLIESSNCNKDVSSNENHSAYTASDKINDKKDQEENIPDVPTDNNSEFCIQAEEITKLQLNLTKESDNTQLSSQQIILPTVQEVVLENPKLLIHEAEPADVPLPDEDNFEKDPKTTNVLETIPLLQTNRPDVEMVQAKMTQIAIKAANNIDLPTEQNKSLSDEMVPLTEVKINNNMLNDVDQTVVEQINTEDKSEIKTTQIELGNEIASVKSVLPDLVNQTNSNDNEQQEFKDLQTLSLEDILQVTDEGNVLSVLDETEHVLHVESVLTKELDLNRMVSSIEHNDSVLNVCDLNLMITKENKIDEELINAAVCIPESINQLDIASKNPSVNVVHIDNAIDKQINATVVDDIPQFNLNETNFKVAIEESIEFENTTKNNANSTILIDNKIDVEPENPSVNIDNVDNNLTQEITVAMVGDVPQLNSNETNEIVTKEESMAIENTTESKLNSTILIDNTSDGQADISVESKMDITSENYGDTSADIDITKDFKLNEKASTAVVIESKLDLTQELSTASVAPSDNILCNEPGITQTSESTNTDVEIIVSENIIPFVSVMEGIDTELKATEDNFNAIENTLPAPSSPPIVSKGYNFNFDEIDNPFATKTKIRMSPPPNTPSKITELTETPYIEFEMPKKAPVNRRKSQPPERKKTAMNKKKLNTTIDAKLSTGKPKTEKETLKSTEDIKPPSQNENHQEPDLGVTTDIDFESPDLKDTKDNTETRETCKANKTLEYEIDEEKKLEQKSSCESSVTNISDVKTTSSEQSTYFSTAASSTESFKSKNVFNLPEIDDMNFNPSATKSKMRQSPPPLDSEENPFVAKPEIKISPDSSMILRDKEEKNINKINMDVEDKMDIEPMEKEVDISNVTSSSKTVEGINLSREVNTEDEDTVSAEGPFLEAEDAFDKESILGDSEFNRMPAQNDDNLESGEMFIDAETFEFLLNQNKTNMVADSGKESLFLKFDPLFAKRISSDGVVAALSNVQKRQSTPTKARPTLRIEASPIAGPSNINVTNEADLSASAEESIEDLNVTVSKPTMIVTPAVNAAIIPRNKSITPNRSNRRSVTFTSPAMAVIDRLLSMSANNSPVNTTVTQSQNEADHALTQLRELLAEKEIDVYNLKAESVDLKDRLNIMESQVKVLEADGNERLKKINELNHQLVEKSKINKSMAAVVEEYERTIASLIAETEQDKKRHTEERMKLIYERDEQTAHLASMEASFSDLHSKYEKSKQVILNFKANEDEYIKSIKGFEANLTKMQNNYEMLKQHATSKLNHANSELEKINKGHEAEVLKLNALLKRNALHITSLEETLAQKTKANDELTAICDELINKVS